MDEKTIRHTYPGGQRTLTAKVLQAKNPALLVEKAKRNVTKKNKLLNFRNLKLVV
jgi:large subunit ribosomal protein L13